MRAFRSKTAFSLVELVTVLTIVGILAAVAIPRFASAGVKQRVDAAARRVITDLNLVRRFAFQSGAGQMVEFDLDAESYLFSGMEDPTLPGERYRVSLSEEPYLVEIKSANFSGTDAFKYNGYGIPDKGGVIVVGAGEEQRSVIVDPDSGEAYLQ